MLHQRRYVGIDRRREQFQGVLDRRLINFAIAAIALKVWGLPVWLVIPGVLLFGMLYFVQGIVEPTEGLIAQPVRSLLKSWDHTATA